MLSTLRPALVLFVLLSVVTGIAYPGAVTLLGKALFSRQVAGSLIVRDGHVIGSELIGQAFSDPRYFWSRPSATAPMPNNAAASIGSNQGPLNPALADAVKGRVEALKLADPGNAAPIPVDLVTASGSGLDPEISPAAARYQIRRVARVRGMSEKALTQLVESLIQGPQWGLFGEARVNVLNLNLALDQLR
jgi:K+-transporting ATPase ATPase C chain